MKKYSGKSIFKGTAIGRILFYSKNQQQVKREKVVDAEAEIERFEAAKTKAVRQLGELHDKAVAEVGEADAMIFEVHAMMLEDDDYNDSVYNII
ncbi:MAG: phosphoenolpyruvate--protein phosphotransferase, partial [Lachnospiraceae bacterium]|nr:phosphoenolpyruvate--protein phosphotransferase [Lachnospiraceae bacterium]